MFSFIGTSELQRQTFVRKISIDQFKFTWIFASWFAVGLCSFACSFAGFWALSTCLVIAEDVVNFPLPFDFPFFPLSFFAKKSSKDLSSSPISSIKDDGKAEKATRENKTLIYWSRCTTRETMKLKLNSLIVHSADHVAMNAPAWQDWSHIVPCYPNYPLPFIIDKNRYAVRKKWILLKK